MNVWLVAVILGIVEGLTEFLPISSTGHLIIAGDILGFTGQKEDIFKVVIQLGAILAVVFLYCDRFRGLARSDPQKKFSGARGLWLLFLTSLPASIVGLLTHDIIKDRLFNPITVALALGIGALAILAVEAVPRRKRCHSLDEITPALALGVGLFQCLALWPGFSRAAATIMGAMILGASRKTAAEYSFIAAVPIMIAATMFDLLDGLALFCASDLAVLAVGFVVSFISAVLAVKGFVHMLGSHTLRPFAYYRLPLAVLVLIIW